jgi:hypothetical protein
MSVQFADTLRCQALDASGNRCPAKPIKKWKGRWYCGVDLGAAMNASVELVRIEPGRCPACGAATVREEIHEQPLLRHGGYGTARRTVTDHCSERECRWWLTSDVSEERPAVPSDARETA